MMQDPSGSFFKTTHWSMVIGATDDSKVLQSLLTTYWGPIYAYIRRSGYPRDQAADLAQEFVAQVLLERGLIERADPERGRFRTFLKTALRNFLIDQHRRSTAKGRGPRGGPHGATVLRGLPPPVLEDLEPAPTEDPAGAFDHQWAATLLSLALKRVEEDCTACGQDVHWAVFKAAVVDPTVGHVSAGTLAEVGERFGVEGADRVSSMIQTVRRKFRRMVRGVVEETVVDPGLAEDELNDLKRFLGL